MPHKYERLGTFPIGEVLPLVPQKRTQSVLRKYCGQKISLSKKNLMLFAVKGTTCCSCGIEGTFLAVERHKKNVIKWHFNLYAIGDDGVEVQITMDHIFPKSKGGSNNMGNLQPMCEPCNLAKGNALGNPDVPKVQKETKCTYSTQGNLTKLTANSRVFVKRKTPLYADLYSKIVIYQLTKSYVGSPVTQGSQLHCTGI